MKKITSTLLAAAIALGTLAGCGGSQGTPGESGGDENGKSNRLVIWSQMNEGEPVGMWQKAIVDRFQAENPDIEVEFQFCGREILTQFQTKLNDKDSESFPDLVIQMSGTMIPLAKEGLFEPLDEAFATPAYDSDKNWGDTFIPKLLESTQVEGKHYFVPESIYTHGFFYDEAMFQRLGLSVPKTWEELMNVCETLKANGIAPITLDGTLDVYNEWWFIRFAERLAGPEQLDKAAKGELSFKDDPKFLEAAQYVHTFVEKGYFQNGYEGSVFPAAQALFTQGKAGMLFCGAWIPSEMESQTPPDMKMKMFSLPVLPNSASERHEEIWANCYAVTKDSKNKENAIAFLKLYSSMSVQEDKAKLKNPSALVDGPVVPELANLAQIVGDATTTSTTYNGLALYGDWFKNVLGPISTEMMTGKLTPEQYIDKLDTATKDYYMK